MNQSEKLFDVITLGCRTNQYESQAYRDGLISKGYRLAKDGEKADVCIINTCTVTQSADQSSRREIRQAKVKHPNAKIVVTGCFSEQNAKEVESYEGVTHVISNKDKENLLELVFPEENFPEFSIRQFEAHTRAFVKVQDGCNSFCTYCIIPYVRGRSRSRSVSDIIDEVKELIRNGYKEVVLTGINVGDYDGNPKDKEKHVTLGNLVRAVDQVPGLERLRISSIDPDEVDEDLLDAVINGKTTCPSMHIVLQAGSNVILKRMNRKYTRQIFIDTVEKLLRACPDFTFTTDIIVGFPGETEAEFEETLDVMKKVKFAKVHMFPYSERPRTKAALYPNKVSSEEIRKRKQKILRFSEKMANELRSLFIGRTMSVLTESHDTQRPGETFGHTENFLGVWVQGEFPANRLLNVELIENAPQGLIGVVR